MISEVDYKPVPYRRQRPVSSVKERIGCQVITWLQPFSFKHPPKNLGNVQMWRVRGQEEKMQSAFLPQSSEGKQLSRPVYSGVVKHYDRFTSDSQGEFIN